MSHESHTVHKQGSIQNFLDLILVSTVRPRLSELRKSESRYPTQNW